jgi:hypothetical protein
MMSFLTYITGYFMNFELTVLEEDHPGIISAKFG